MDRDQVMELGELAARAARSVLSRLSYSPRGPRRRMAGPEAQRELLRAAHRWCDRHIDRSPTDERRWPVVQDGAVRGLVATRERAAALSSMPADALETLIAARPAQNTDEPGYDGTWYSHGRKTIQRQTPDYDRPVIARGQRHDYGVLERLFRTSPQAQRAVTSTLHNLTGATFRIDASPEGLAIDRFGAELQAGHAERAVFGARGGWRQVLTEATISCMTAGFALWIRVDDPDNAAIKRYAHRRPNTVDRWIFSEDGDELVAVELFEDQGGTYLVPAEHLILVRWLDYALDMEPAPPMRSAAPFIVAKQLGMQAWGAAIEKYALPVVFLENETEDAGDIDELISVWDKFDFTDFPVISGRRGTRASILNPGQSTADIESFLRYCDEHIALPFSSEGALIGMNRVGAYNLADVKDSQQLRVALHLADQICAAWNGDRYTAHNGVVSHVVQSAFGIGGAIGGMPKLVYMLGEEDVPMADILGAIQAGAVVVTPEVQETVHARLKLPAPPERQITASRLTAAREPNHERMGRQMDRAERRLARELDELGARMRSDWEALIRDTEGRDLLEDREKIRRAYLEQYREAVRRVVLDLAEDAAGDALAELDADEEILRENDLTAARFRDLPRELLALVASVAEEALNRQLGVLTDKAVEQERGDTRQRMPKLSPRTLRSIASKAVSGAYNAGRDAAAKAVKRVRGRKVMGTRNAILDERTCEACRALDGERAELGSKRYREIVPPNRCEGMHRCRCVMDFEEI